MGMKFQFDRARRSRQFCGMMTGDNGYSLHILKKKKKEGFWGLVGLVSNILP